MLPDPYDIHGADRGSIRRPRSVWEMGYLPKSWFLLYAFQDYFFIWTSAWHDDAWLDSPPWDRGRGLDGGA